PIDSCPEPAPAPRKSEAAAATNNAMPSPTPDEILDAAPTTTRIIKMEANVIAYFGDFFHAYKEGLKREITAGPATSAHIAPSNTSSAHSPTQK
ncbi:MAG: hypothetical protein EBY32_20100, partial [Proteobacteria bacterium]|nr:hypothetical protein [Pseudomonadota bacterium]